MAYAQFSDLSIDVLQIICTEINKSSPDQAVTAFDGFSKSAKCYRQLCTPFIFGHLVLRGGYEDAARGISEMLKCPNLIASARTFKVDISEGDAVGLPMAATAQQLVLLLNVVRQIEMFYLRLPEVEATQVEPLFRKGKIILPNVKTLAISQHCEFAIPACPKLTTLSTTPNSWLLLTGPLPYSGIRSHRQSIRLIRAVANSAHLKHIEMTERWNTSLLRVVHGAVPHTTSLAMTGSAYRDSLTVMLPTLAQFSNLEHLVVAEVGGLHIGYMLPKGVPASTLVDSASWACITDSPDLDMPPYVLEAVKKYDAAQLKVARILFEKIPTLQDVWIGDLRRFERTDHADTIDVYTEPRTTVGWEYM